jgi:N-glycosylase/DNA lyase
MQKIKVNNFNLKHTMECGNFFRYFEKHGFYYVATADKAFKVKQKGDFLFFDGVDVKGKKISKEFIVIFFRLEEDYGRILRAIRVDDKIKGAISQYMGLRIIRQEPFECLVSYIVSQNSNIPRIRKNLNDIARLFGRKFKFDGMNFYAFPKLSQLTGNKLKICKLGYRYEYLCRLVKELDLERLYSLKDFGYGDAKKYLVSLHGIGSKVADCVLLFSLDFLEAFPVDVWIKRVVERLYFNENEMTEKMVHEFGIKHFGKYAGYANQFLYYYGRSLK